MKNLVIIKDNQVVTTSMKVADIFGKRHCDVIRKINELVGSLREQEDLRKRNFAYSQEKEEILRKHNFVLSQNASETAMFHLVQQNMKTPTGGIKSNPMYLMTRDGFTLLAMGFTGAKALQFKLAYIQAFNEMEAKLKQGGANIAQTGKSVTVSEHTRSLPAGKKEIVLSEKAREEIGGIVKSCVGSVLKNQSHEVLAELVSAKITTSLMYIHRDELALKAEEYRQRAASYAQAVSNFDKNIKKIEAALAGK